MAMSDEDLTRIARENGTPFYIYDAESITDQFVRLRAVLGEFFDVSYAVKANPNLALLRLMLPYVATFDVSSYKEIERALEVGCPAHRITFSGPAKRQSEIRGAIEQRIGELVVESLFEAEIADDHCRERGVRQPILLRINPSSGPKHFGVSFSGRSSQFGVDEESLEEAIDSLSRLANLDLVGFHIYSGTNSLNPDAIAENFTGFIRIFRRASTVAGISPKKLVFGAGFGLPYGASDKPLDLDAVAALIGPAITELKRDSRFRDTECVLEMGRWLVGPGGLLVTGVVGEKTSRGVNLRLCDAGFNNHLAAFGMMGTVIKRNWRIRNVSNPSAPPGKYTLVGPLCTSIDVMAADIVLPAVARGEVLVIENSGAYGLTASPTRFISHPEPKEYLKNGNRLIDVTESMANRWTDIDPEGRLLDGSSRRPKIECA